MPFRIARIDHECDYCGEGIEIGRKLFIDSNRVLCEEHGHNYQNGDLKKVRKSHRYININTRVGIDPCSKCSDVSTHIIDGKLICNEHVGEIITYD